MVSRLTRWSEKAEEERARFRSEHVRWLSIGWVLAALIIVGPLREPAPGLMWLTIPFLLAGYVGALIWSRRNAPLTYFASVGVWVVLCVTTSLLAGATDDLPQRLVLFLIGALIIGFFTAVLCKKWARRRFVRRDERERESRSERG